MPIYNPKRGPVVKIIMVAAILASLNRLWQMGLDDYRDENPYAGMPSEFQSAMGDMGLEYAYTGEINTSIEKMLQAYGSVDTATASVITSNGTVWSVTVTLTGDGWRDQTATLAARIKEKYPDTKVTFYDSNVNTVYSD